MIIMNVIWFKEKYYSKQNLFLNKFFFLNQYFFINILFIINYTRSEECARMFRQIPFIVPKHKRSQFLDLVKLK